MRATGERTVYKATFLKAEGKYEMADDVERRFLTRMPERAGEERAI